MTEPLPPDAAHGMAGGRLTGNLNRFAKPRFALAIRLGKASDRAGDAVKRGVQ
jgi:hypothetical protein